MFQSQSALSIRTNGKGLIEITRQVAAFVADSGVGTGLLALHCRHTSASLLISENASSAVQRDLLRWLERAAPETDDWEHDDEGPDDMPAHVRGVLTGVCLSVPVAGRRMVLGTWQGIFLAEHRRHPHIREVVCHILGQT